VGAGAARAALTGEALKAFCKGRIANYKIPAYWRFVDSFPMTVTGKVQKFRMREMAVADLHLEQAAEIATA
jgi:fatty-acyl-CoA synthase